MPDQRPNLFSIKDGSLPSGALRKIPVTLVDADPNQPRTEFDQARVQSLKESIATAGLIEPIIVEESEATGRFTLIAGEYRLRALRMGHAEDPKNPVFIEVNAIVFSEGQIPEPLRVAWQLIENVQRKDLSPGEIAGGLRVAKDALALDRALQTADRRHIALDGYPVGASVAQRAEFLRPRLEAAHVAWPDPEWGEVFAAVGLNLTGGNYMRIKAILGLADPIIAKCDEMGLSKNAAASIASLTSEALQLELLNIVEDLGDNSLIYPAAGLLASDPAIGAKEAVDRILFARSSAKRAKEEAEEGLFTTTSLLPNCQAEDFDGIISALTDLTDRLESFQFDKYQRGSLRLWVERMGRAVDPQDDAKVESA